MEQRRLRQLLLITIAFLIFVVNSIIILYESIGFSNWVYVSNVANGVVAASGILMATTVFSLNYFNGTITKESTRKNILPL